MFVGHGWLNCVGIPLLSKLLEPSVPNSAFVESGSTPGVFSIVLKLILAHSCWVNDSMKKAKMGQDSLFIDLFLSPGINEISLKGLTIPASLSMQFQLYASKGPLFGSCRKIYHRQLYSLGMKWRQLAMAFSRWQSNGIY